MHIPSCPSCGSIDVLISQDAIMEGSKLFRIDGDRAVLEDPIKLEDLNHNEVAICRDCTLEDAFGVFTGEFTFVDE